MIRLHTALADVCFYSLSTDDGRVQFCELADMHLVYGTFGEHCIGHGGPIAWPPRSADLTPLDFLCEGIFK